MKKVIYCFLGLLILSSCLHDGESNILKETLYVRYKGADMPAYVHGNADSKVFLIVVHGAGSFGLSFRSGIFTDELEEEFGVVYFDQRGQSMAQGHYENPEQLIQLMAEDVQALIKVLQNKYGTDYSYFLLGHSLGGLITASSLASADIQNDLKGWINVDGALDLSSVSSLRKDLLLAISNEQIMAENGVEEWTDLRQDVEALDPQKEEDYSAILRAAGKASSLLEKFQVVEQVVTAEKLQRSIIDNNPIHWFIANYFNAPVDVAIEQQINVFEELDEISIPSLFLYGKYDISVPPKIGVDAFTFLASEQKEFYLFKKSIHHPMDSEPELFGNVMIEFINKHK